MGATQAVHGAGNVPVTFHAPAGGGKSASARDADRRGFAAMTNGVTWPWRGSALAVQLLVAAPAVSPLTAKSNSVSVAFPALGQSLDGALLLRR